MTKEELKEQDIRLNKLCFDYQEKEKRIEELEEKISVLLSCKNCPENKGGLLCQKEYEDKCLAQKIQYIKELQEENAELKKEWQEQVQKATDEGYARTLQTIQLTKAKEIIRNLLSAYTTYADSFDDRDNEIVDDAVQFLDDEGCPDCLCKDCRKDCGIKKFGLVEVEK